eukprot:1156289-Pelagomonas_calceolata.AAC.5
MHLACMSMQLTREEAHLDFSRPALSLHNTVRGFAGWPGTSASFVLRDKNTGERAILPTGEKGGSFGAATSRQDGFISVCASFSAGGGQLSQH